MMVKVRHTGWRRLVIALALAGSTALTACGDGPEERLIEARLAVERGDFDEFRTYFTQQSAELLRSLQATTDRTRYRYVPNLLRLLPEGNITEVFIKDNFALVTLEDRNVKHEIRMLMENGVWVVDLLALRQFWASIER